MAIEILEKPDVRVFQEFGPEAPSLIRPLLEGCIVGQCFQIVEKAVAGQYYGAIVSFAYPGLKVGAAVVLAKTKVFLQQGTDEYDITTSLPLGGGTITANAITFPASFVPSKVIVPQAQVSPAAGTIFTDPNGQFVTLGVRPGDKLTFVTLLANLIKPNSVVSTQPGPFVVLNVLSETQLEIATPLIAETNVEYKITRFGTSSGDVVVSYTALRTDLVGQLIECQTNDDVVNQLGTITPDNPLAYGVFIALLHTQSVVAAVAVAADSLTDYTAAFEFLESKEVYAIAPLTNLATVHEALQRHVNLMSDPKSKRERIGLFNPLILDKTVFQASSATGSVPISSAIITDVNAKFVTNGVPIGALIVFATPHSFGGSPVSSIPILSVISETQVQVTATADAAVPVFTYTVESRPYTKLQQALNVQGIGKGYHDRRMVMEVPDTVEVEKDTLIVDVPGYYLAAAEAGLISGTSPAQGFTNFPFAGFVGLKKSNFYFNETQLGVMAAGGAHIFIQETLGGPITVRHQLTTDVSSVAKRELSIVKAVDFVAKYLRNSIRRLIGINNITDAFLDNILRPQTNGILQDLIEDRIIGRGTKITNLVQDPVQKDTVKVDITLEVLYPANFIDFTLII